MDRIQRLREYAREARPDLDRILDANQVGVLSTVVDSQPWSVPLLYARIGDSIVLHGSTGAGALRHVAAGAEANFCVFQMTGIVVADTLFDSSAQYSSAVVRGRLRVIQGDEATKALVQMSDRLIPGRSLEVADPTAKELAATLALALEITDDNWTAKVQPDGAEEPSDPTRWTGVVPMRTTYGPAEPSRWATGMDLPNSVRALCAEAE
ncbi:MAG: pyridoxamine 5'-phosphate oxidase family protein [Nocardioidaceae bacterium]|nr:pyridoxamine 5'-phosphate oxidase family protein [Marmoricola sp.]